MSGDNLGLIPLAVAVFYCHMPPITPPPRRPGLEFQTYDDATNALRWFRLEPWMFSLCRWRTIAGQRFRATSYLQLHAAGVVVGSEMDGLKPRPFDVRPGDYVVRGQDDSCAVLMPWQFKLLCRRVLADYGRAVEGENDE